MRKAQCFLRGQFHVHTECFVGLFLMFSSATSPCNEFIWQQKTAHDGKGHRSSSAKLWPMQELESSRCPQCHGLAGGWFCRNTPLPAPTESNGRVAAVGMAGLKPFFGC